MTRSSFLPIILILMFSSPALGTVPFPAAPEGMAHFNGNWSDLPDVSVPTNKALEQTELKGRSRTELQVMRNSILARHGFEFTMPWLAAYFKSRPWYKRGGFRKESLTPVEKQNVNLLLKAELDLAKATIASDHQKQIEFKSLGEVDPETRKRAELLQQEAAALRKKQKFNEALAIYEKLAKEFPYITFGSPVETYEDLLKRMRSVMQCERERQKPQQKFTSIQELLKMLKASFDSGDPRNLADLMDCGLLLFGEGDDMIEVSSERFPALAAVLIKKIKPSDWDKVEKSEGSNYINITVGNISFGTQRPCPCDWSTVASNDPEIIRAAGKP